MARKFIVNPHTEELDAVEDMTELDGRFVNITGDTMTGDLTLPALEATNPGYSVFNGGVIIKAGQKLIFDGSG